MNIHTVQFSHILETSDLQNLHYFLSHTVFVISHKSEKVKTLREVLWYLPLNSPIIIVTNCQESERENLTNELKLRVGSSSKDLSGTPEGRNYRSFVRDLWRLPYPW